MLESLTSRFGGALSSLRAKGRIKSGDLDEICDELRAALIDSDVALSAAERFVGAIKERASAELEDFNKSTNPSQALFEIINSELISILGGQGARLHFAKKPPTIILLAGLQGAGKTTAAGKLAAFLKKEGNTPILVASDLQRPNAVTQLQVVGESAKVPVFAPEPGNGSGDPVKVARDGVAYAREKLHNIVIVDTAGRLGVDEEMMDQARRIRDAVNPDNILFVVDAMIGQDAVKVAEAFRAGVGFDGVLLTKLDGDARGGAALSIASTTGRSILFASTGEKLADFDYFYPDRMASRILGMGDVQTLAEQAKAAMDSTSAARLEEKFRKGDQFTLSDFLEQLEAMKKMGSMSKLLGLLPGASSGAIKKQLEGFDDKELIRTQAIVQSMTPAEREDPKVLNGSRRARIAKGSGRQVSEVNSLIERFTQAQKAMKMMQGGKVPPALAGMAGPLPTNFGRPAAVQPPKKKSRSGNPAKRAAEERGL